MTKRSKPLAITDLKEVVFATPSLTHSVAMEFFGAAIQTNLLLLGAGYYATYIHLCGDQFVAKARSKLVNDFLVNHPNAETLFFIDDDLGWPAEKALEFIQRPQDVVVGVYPKRQDEEDWPVMLAGHEGELVEKDGLVACLRAPTGFMRIKRHVLEAMLPHLPSFLDTKPGGETQSTPGFFAAGPMPDGWWWTEDYVFSNNITSLGFEIWADPDVDFTHRGEKAWTGNMTTALPLFRERATQAEQARKSDAT